MNITSESFACPNSNPIANLICDPNCPGPYNAMHTILSTHSSKCIN